MIHNAGDHSGNAAEYKGPIRATGARARQQHKNKESQSFLLLSHFDTQRVGSHENKDQFENNRFLHFLG